jgi:nucleoside-diphosphate-sugar epimerase
MSNVLVTGGAGFIGSHVVDGLISEGHNVIAVDDMSNGRILNVDHNINNKNFKIYFASILDESMADVFESEKIDCVLHLAAIPSVPLSMNEPFKTFNVNTLGTAKLLELSRKFKIKKFVFSSSSSVYGSTDQSALDEYMSLNPLSHYALQKKTSEEYCTFYSKVYGLHTVILRYFNVFGDRQRDDSPYSSVMAAFAKSKYENKSPIIYGDGTQTRDFTHVKNVVHANILAMNEKYMYDGGNIYNIGSGNPISINDLAKLWNFSDIIYKEERSGDVKHSCANLNLSMTSLKYSPLINLKDGIEDYYLKYKKERELIR